MKTWCGAWLLILLWMPGAYASSIDATANLERHADGAAIHLSFPLSDSVNARIGFNSFITQHSWLTTGDAGASMQQTTFGVKRKYDNYDVLLDWFPFNNYFRLTAGLVFVSIETRTLIKADWQTDSSNGHSVTNELVTTTYTVNSAAPYLGIGLGLPEGRSYRRGLSVDLGVMFHHTPAVLSGSSYCAASHVSCRQVSYAVSLKKQQIDRHFDEHRYLMARVGVTYRF